MKKHLLFFIILIAASFSAMAQNNDVVKLDSLFIATRNIIDPTMDVPPSVFDTVARALREVELNVSFHINNLTNLKSIEFRYGTHSGIKDILDLNFIPSDINGVTFLTCQGRKFPVVKGKVFITWNISELSLAKSDYVWLNAVDKMDRPSNVLTGKN